MRSFLVSPQPNGMPMPTFILKHKMPHGFLCFVTNSLSTLEKSEEVFMLRVRIPDKEVMVVSSLYLCNTGTLRGIGSLSPSYY
jgi:hypothetical protein